MIRFYPDAEILIDPPTEERKYWIWVVFLPNTPSQTVLRSGKAKDQEDAWKKATIAKNVLQKNGRLPER